MGPTMQRISDEGRSRIMRGVRSKDTKIEMDLRRRLRRRGLCGYRVHVPDLPGKPDVCYTRWKVAVFVDGCFWHGCPQCGLVPAKNTDYWSSKLERNRARDRQNTEDLERRGFAVLRFWEHEFVDNPDVCVGAIKRVLAARGRRL